MVSTPGAELFCPFFSTLHQPIFSIIFGHHESKLILLRKNVKRGDVQKRHDKPKVGERQIGNDSQLSPYIGPYKVGGHDLGRAG